MKVVLNPHKAARLMAKLPQRVDKQARIAIKEAIRTVGWQDLRALRKVGQVIYYRGHYMAGFEFKQVTNSYNFTNAVMYTLKNEAPHAGILENGTPPLNISSAHFQRIVVWAMEKLNLPKGRAFAVAQSVRERVANEGYPANKYIWKQVETSLGRIVKHYLRSFEARLKNKKMLA